MKLKICKVLLVLLEERKTAPFALYMARKEMLLYIACKGKDHVDHVGEATHMLS
jgi:hypothetical protein